MTDIQTSASNATKSGKLTFSQRRPVWAVVVIELLLMVAVAAAGTYATLKGLSYTAPVLLSFIPIALALIVYMTLRRRWGYYGFRSLKSIPKSGYIYYLPLLAVLVAISFKGFRPLTIQEILFFLFFTLLVGFVEETVYRGLIFKTMLKKGAVAAIVTSSILFSITHVLNALSGQSLAATLLQLLYALLVGCALALLLLKNGNILPLIAFHFLHNLIQFLGVQTEYIPADVVVLVILAAQCAWLIASMKKRPAAAMIAPTGTVL
ncbi:CPBP family intramembrane metalloprotease [Saccharibacillus sp. CPCC 101409]|uniref:CPBP family intramembrane glutamic endopeptidase n=1 Tax=Saccharibacillus sp. CPCC 101409 TaxID=3058041 RepID=UPI002670F265|nr:CPBP family intramembrane glutamic endopeptidase [Saccharibacillus sp. CPCC 101409]MDO3408210.1 CPBP family intramembrane metalloprotease [Saccharibacillus sp. CPCC 101409]